MAARIGRGYMKKNGARFAFSASFLTFAMVLAAPAQAQDAAADEAESVDASEIVVTGSLIRRPNNSSASPIVTVGNDAIKEAGTPNLNDALNQFPSFTTAGNAATGGQGTGGRATINLHGLGSNRNLVLLDGKRLPVSDVNGNVDVNIIPESIIGGIDVITGGASAVYGSDAMSGVVNFKTLREFEGIRMDGQYNIWRLAPNSPAAAAMSWRPSAIPPRMNCRVRPVRSSTTRCPPRSSAPAPSCPARSMLPTPR
jgi:iron complex outermembrane receptor protein